MASRTSGRSCSSARTAQSGSSATESVRLTTSTTTPRARQQRPRVRGGPGRGQAPLADPVLEAAPEPKTAPPQRGHHCSPCCSRGSRAPRPRAGRPAPGTTRRETRCAARASRCPRGTHAAKARPSGRSRPARRAGHGAARACRARESSKAGAPIRARDRGSQTRRQCRGVLPLDVSPEEWLTGPLDRSPSLDGIGQAARNIRGRAGARIWGSCATDRRAPPNPGRGHVSAGSSTAFAPFEFVSVKSTCSPAAATKPGGLARVLARQARQAFGFSHRTAEVGPAPTLPPRR